MKLLKRTYYYTAVWLLPVIIVGSVFCFLMIEYIAYEETDEFLTYEMERLVNYHEKFGDLPEYRQAVTIIPNTAYKKPFFKDTLLLEPGDNEMVPYRELHFSINLKGQDSGIVLRHLLLGRDDIAQGTLLIVVGLMALIGLVLIVMVNHITGRIWRPFYRTLDSLINFKIDNPLPVFPETTIDEFRVLNSTLHALLKKIADDFRHNKEFNGNTSHELQTHLAIIRAATERLLNDESVANTRLDELKTIYSAATRLSQAQKSLLLLSKIDNREYGNDVDLDFANVVRRSVESFREAAGLRGIRIDCSLGSVTLRMDAGLAEILMDNLVKNAVKHNVDNGYIAIRLDAPALTVENSGLPFKGDPGVMFERFAKGDNGNLGIGLAIAKQICELYGFSISYSISERNDHVLNVQFSPDTKTAKAARRATLDSSFDRQTRSSDAG